MKAHRYDARKRLRESNRAEYNDLVQAAHLTPIQKRALELYIVHGRSISSIAMELFCCEATVRNCLARAYDKVAKV